MADNELIGATVLAVEEKRWDVRITFRLADGTERTMIASADGYYTDQSGVWWGTAAEHAGA